jgi:hypothetical protein
VVVVKVVAVKVVVVKAVVEQEVVEQEVVAMAVEVREPEQDKAMRPADAADKQQPQPHFVRPTAKPKPTFAITTCGFVRSAAPPTRPAP